MSSFVPFFLFLSILFLLQYPSLVSATAHTDIVRKTCKQCSDSSPNVDYNLCVASLGSVPKSHRSNLRGLGVISAKLAVANATQIRRKVKKLLETKSEDPLVKSCLKTCLDLYKDAISNLKVATMAIKSGRYDDANLWISSAVDASGGCEDSFADGNVDMSPLVVEDIGFFKLAVITLAITAVLR